MTLRVIHGGGEIVAFLEAMLEKARTGQFDIVAVATCETDGNLGSGLAFRDADMPFSRTLGAIANLQHDVLTGRLTFER